jgi:hypothetical protein
MLDFDPEKSGYAQEQDYLGCLLTAEMLDIFTVSVSFLKELCEKSVNIGDFPSNMPTTPRNVRLPPQI